MTNSQNLTKSYTAKSKRQTVKDEMRALIPFMRNVKTKAGAAARLKYHSLAVSIKLESSIPPWIIQAAREQGVQA